MWIYAVIMVSTLVLTKGAQPLLDCHADVAFVLDSSGSVGGGNWALVQRFLQDFVTLVKFGPGKMQVGVVSFGNAAHLDVPLNKCQVPDCFKLAVRRIPYLDENTNTSGGIYTTRTQLFTPERGDRPEAANLMVLVTDGRATFDVEKTLPEARLAREAGIHILAVGVGYEISKDELFLIVNNKTEDLLYVNDFRDLLRSVGRVLNSTCRTEPVTTALPSTTTTTTQTTTTTIPTTTTTAEASTPTSTASTTTTTTTEASIPTSTATTTTTKTPEASTPTSTASTTTTTTTEPSTPTSTATTTTTKKTEASTPTSTATTTTITSAIPKATTSSSIATNTTISSTKSSSTTSTTLTPTTPSPTTTPSTTTTTTTTTMNTETPAQAITPVATLKPGHTTTVTQGSTAKNIEKSTSPPSTTLSSLLSTATTLKQTPSTEKASTSSANLSSVSTIPTLPPSSTTFPTTTFIVPPSTRDVSTRSVAPTLPPIFRSPCENIDLILLLDSSGSVQAPNWDRMKDVAKVIASAVMSDTTRVGVVSFSSEAFLNVQLGVISDRASLVAAIDEIPWISQMTNISGALRIARREMFGTTFDRQDAENIILVLTDGRANRDIAETEPEAERVKTERGARIFTVGIGPEVDVRELRGVASDPDMFYMMLVPDFGELTERTEEIFARTCMETPPPVPRPRPWGECPFDLVFVLSNPFGDDSVDALSRYLLVYAVYNLNFDTHRLGVVSTGALGALRYYPTEYASRESFYSYLDESANVGPTQPLDKDFRLAVDMLRDARRSGLPGLKVITIIAPTGIDASVLSSLKGDARKAQEEGIYVHVVTDLERGEDLSVIASQPSVFFLTSIEGQDPMDICLIAGPNTFGCDFENVEGARTLCDISQSTSDDFDWALQTGTTPSRHTGPERAYSGSYYVYVEASSPRKQGEQAELLIPPSTVGGVHCLFFFYHMRGWHVGRLEVVLRPGNGARDQMAWLLKGPQADSWKMGMVTLMIAPADRVVFRAILGGAFSGDIALDSIRLTQGACPTMTSYNMGLVIQ